jgi:hypothetical protein
MYTDWTTVAAAVFVCESDLDLRVVCHQLQCRYQLPDFLFTAHGTSERARSFSECLGLNISKNERLGEMAQWMEGIPLGVNYQIILYLNEACEQNTNAPVSTVPTTQAFLSDVFKSKILVVQPYQP